ncbi:MinD/ParA family protein [Microbacterium sp. SORGH_AS_0888]|uniref:MinD/ParA family ATP-binding protein n=1 Tax=Microbacterium sp. SORGH_AS_0888 TaxID=3041791 RepID=UPI0027828F3F|nr:MinD/ParA family protein [Microbacterium sp. SORGH_AS_0888]MDQ1128899.1 MinD-like ATPase involved in chromosome partitioning or flagellar assembly [Microbacterium sp. SORGH_AS_0888]
MPDRPEPDPEDLEVVPSASVDAAAIDLGTQTAQVSIVLPVEHADDDLVEDDLPCPIAAETEDGEDVVIAEAEPLHDVPAPVTVRAVETLAVEAVTVEPEEPSLASRESDAAPVPDAAAAVVPNVVEAEASESEPVSRAESVEARDVADRGAEDRVAASHPAEPDPVTNAAPVEADPVTVTGAAASAPASTSVPALRRHHVDTATVALAAKRVGERTADRESPDLLTHDRLVETGRLPKAEPAGLWPHLVYTLSARRINLGDSRRARERKALDARIAAPLSGGARFVAVLSRKGGVGKTTVTTLLGMALADAREDRVIAVDANPDRGTLADRIGAAGGKTVRDLSRARTQVHGFNELSAVVARDRTRLDVLASDADPRVSEAFNDSDYRDVAELAAHYYSIVLTDTGTGIVHSVMDATLTAADGLVIVAGLSVDEARLASETLTWLETNGYGELAREAVVVLNTSRPGVPLVRATEVEEHFRTRVRAVVRIPYDALLATGGVISFADLEGATREAARQLAATVVEGLAPRTVTAA